MTTGTVLLAAAAALGCPGAETPPEGAAPPGAASRTAPAERLVGVDWVLDAVQGQPAADDVESTVRFAKDGTVSGHGGCNRFTGSYTVADDRLEIGPLASTKMACPEPMMAQEGLFLAALDQAERFEVMNGLLFLYPADGGEPTRLMPLEVITEGTATLTGSVFFKNHRALPPDGRLIVRLLEVSRPPAPDLPAAELVGETVVEPVGEPPISFEIFYDPANADPAGTYEVEAMIMVGDTTFYRTAEDAPGEVHGLPEDGIELTLYPIR